MRVTDKFVFFWRTAEVYSQWHPSVFYVDGRRFDTAERFMMVGKARVFNDVDVEHELLTTPNLTPAAVKALGRKVKGYNDAVWKQHRSEVVFQGNLAKFSQNAAMARELLASGDRLLVEASPVDRIWGVGLAEDDPRIEDPAKWLGLNLLGEALMRVRQHLRENPLPSQGPLL